jgi:hypothetical protein
MYDWKLVTNINFTKHFFSSDKPWTMVTKLPHYVRHVENNVEKKRRFVATLALGLWPREGLARVWAKREAWESHFFLPGMQNSVREWTLTLPREFLLWELEPWWTPEFSESNRRGQNSLDWGTTYIIEKILERRCLKWACMTHLDIWNTSHQL